MIYLAKNEKGKLERIQVIRKYDIQQGASLWGALNHDGTEEIVPFSSENVNYECVVNILIEKYGNITISKRKVDSYSMHIVCIEKTYYLLDNCGHIHDRLGDVRVTFLNTNGDTITVNSCTLPGFPDYYSNIEVIHKDKLWVAKDIDTELWVCINSSGKVVCEHHVKGTCIYDSIRKLS